MRRLSPMFLGVSSLLLFTPLIWGASLPSRDLYSPSSSTIRRGSDLHGPICAKEGPSVNDIRWKEGDWSASWLYSVAGALVNARPDDLRKSWEDEDLGNVPANQDATEASIALFNKDGERIKTKTLLSDIGKTYKAANIKHDTSATSNWWLAASEMAAVKMGGFEGLEGDKITSAGSPLDAFKMLTNKSAKIDDIHPEQVELVWDLLTDSKVTPIVIKLSQGAWWTVISAMPNGGEKPWQNSTVEIYDPSAGKTESIYLPAYLHDIKQVAHWTI
ncbi:uncharacterized protein IL334_005348 [Kwoniella shivajii]|uniref:Calpain catalytic domain-containing protein n=1 Tax=Kwoniella shivajii TaxID=564305 RepID=A0ABZ1D469_9TREE|nr:hypothetical protein IL334_005348 [Kwoniella shivajii]